MFNQRYLLILKCLFGLLLIISIVLGFNVHQTLNIDTNLSELSPKNQHSPHTKAAIQKLSDNVEKRALLLITGIDEDAVLDASDALETGLNSVTGLRVHPNPETIAGHLLDILKPYRFALLNDQQRSTLNSTDHASIVATAKTDMFALSSATRFYPFDQDPLGWHSDFIQSLFASLQPPETNSNQFHSVTSFSIDDGSMNMQRQAILSNELDQLSKQLTDEFDINIERSGVFFFAAQAAKNSKQDISFITTGSSIGVILLLLLAFRSVWGLILPVVSVLTGVAFAFVITHSIFANVHVLTIVFGASLIGIVIDYSLHYFYHVSANSSSRDARKNNALYRALLLSLLTSLIGYASLSFSGLQALQKVAVFSCCGLFMAWLSVICIGDLTTRKPLSLNQTILPKLETWLSNTVAKLSQRSWIIISFVVVLLGAFIAQQDRAFNDDPRLFFNASAELLESEQAVAQVANDYEPGRYLIVQGDNTAQVYKRTEQLMSILRQNPDFDLGSLTSLANWLPSLKQQQQNYQLQRALYGQNGIAYQLIEQLGGSANLSNKLNAEYQAAQQNFIQPDEIATLLNASTPPLWISDEQRVTSFILIDKGSDTAALADAASQINGIEYINTLQKTKDALQQQRYSASKLLVFAYVLVALLLTLRYRSLTTTAMLLVPLSASALVLLLCFMLGQSFNLFHIMALFLVLGFGMDYTIFAREIGNMRAITLQAILLSAATSVLSFGLLSISSIPVAHSFGITLLIGNCFNLLGVFIYSYCLQRH